MSPLMADRSDDMTGLSHVESVRSSLADIVYKFGLRVISPSREVQVQWLVPDYYGSSILPEMGFKIHISALPSNMEEVAERIVPLLVLEDTDFKMIPTPTLLEQFNRGVFGFSQVGKFITIYPTSSTEALDITKRMEPVCRGAAGPRVPSDRRIYPGSIIHYRYGSLIGDGPENEVSRQMDSRRPGKAIPREVHDPIAAYWDQAMRDANHSESESSFFSRFIVLKALRQRPKGGVYLALDRAMVDQHRDRLVVIKERRLHGEATASNGSADDFAMQVRALELVESLRIAPRLSSYHRFSESDLIVMEYLPGSTLHDLIVEAGDPSYLGSIYTNLTQAVPVMQRFVCKIANSL